MLVIYILIVMSEFIMVFVYCLSRLEPILTCGEYFVKGIPEVKGGLMSVQTELDTNE
jgi:hypothetical protein